jgi:hypothetical protein
VFEIKMLCEIFEPKKFEVSEQFLILLLSSSSSSSASR